MFAATCSRGLEEVLADELRLVGADTVREGRGVVRFRGDLAVLYRAVLWLRTGMRVLAHLARGPAADRDGLYALAARVPWEEVLTPERTFAVEAVGLSRGVRHSGFAAQVVKDAVVDRLRRVKGRRPSVQRRHPDVRIHLHLADEGAELTLDAAGEPLSHRGYRRHGGPAPLNEATAAGILMLAGFDGARPLVDPLCGGGTLAVEAGLLATRTAPGLERSFACERWPWHRAGLLASLREDARRARRAAPHPVLAADHDAAAVEAARRHVAAAGLDGMVVAEVSDVRRLAVPGPGTLVVSNPPYGHRLGDVDQLRDLYRAIGDALKQRAPGCTAWLLVGRRELAKEIGLKPARRIVLFNGPIECRLLRFDLWEGSRT
jgi:putative N6-adenine-specific DNA methylase